MSLLQRLLLLPLLSPLLAVLLLGSLNPRPGVSLRLLIWSTPAWPLGAWLGGAAAAGAALSAAGTGLALQSGGSGLSARRQVRRRPADEADTWDGDSVAPPREPRRTEPWEASPSPPGRNPWGSWAGPTRAAAEPPPTVSVPFRVIRKGRGPAAAPAQPRAGGAAAAAGDAGTGDGWDSPTSDDW